LRRVVLLEPLRVLRAAGADEDQTGPEASGLVADRAQERGGRDLALAVNLDREQVLVARLELEPGAARRDDLRDVEVLVGRLVDGALEVDTW